MVRVLAVLLLASTVFSVAACDPEPADRPSPDVVTPQEEPGKKKKKEKPVSKQEELKRKKLAGKKGGLPGVPKLTGDYDKDVKAVRSALVRLKTEWDHNKKLLDEVLHDHGHGKKKPDEKRTRALKAKNDMYKARAAKLQELMTKLKASRGKGQ